MSGTKISALLDAGALTGAELVAVVSDPGGTPVTERTTVDTIATRALSVAGFEEAVDDRVSSLLVQGANVTISYNDAGNTLTVAAPLPAPAVIAGQWISHDMRGAATAAVAINTLYLSPIPIWGTFTIDRLAVRVTVGSAGNLKLGAYTWDGSQFVLLQEITADISTSGTGIFAGTPAANIALTGPTLLWVGSCFSATPTVVGFNAAAATGGGAQVWIGHPDPPALNLISTAAGGARITRTTSLTYVAGSAFFPATIASSDITVTLTSPGSPVPLVRRA